MIIGDPTIPYWVLAKQHPTIWGCILGGLTVFVHPHLLRHQAGCRDVKPGLSIAGKVGGFRV